MSQAQPRVPSNAELEAMRRLRADEERRKTGGKIAEAATTKALAEGDYAAPGYWDTITKLDFAREAIEDDYIEDFIRIEGSKFNALGDIPFEKWGSFCWRIENELFARRNELQDNDKLDDADIATMYGRRLPKHTNEREGRLKATERALKLQLSLSINARGLRSGTEIHAVARSESGEPEPEPQGRLARAKEYFSR